MLGDNDIVIVVEYDRHDNPDSMFIETRQNAIKRYLIHNINNIDEKNYTEIETIKQLIKEEQWQKAWDKWHELGISPRAEIYRPIEFYPLNTPSKFPTLN